MKHLFAAVILQLAVWLIAWGLQQTDEGLDWIGIGMIGFIFVLSVLEFITFFQVLKKERKSK